MHIQLTENNPDKTLEVRVSGKLTHEDYSQFVPAFESMFQRHGRLRVLFEMVDFHGWQAGALWDDLKFDFKHFADIERLAMVGDKRWEKGMSQFCRPFTTAKIRYFEHAELDEARRWLAESELHPVRA